MASAPILRRGLSRNMLVRASSSLPSASPPTCVAPARRRPFASTTSPGPASPTDQLKTGQPGPGLRSPPTSRPRPSPRSLELDHARLVDLVQPVIAALPPATAARLAPLATAIVLRPSSSDDADVEAEEVCAVVWQKHHVGHQAVISWADDAELAPLGPAQAESFKLVFNARLLETVSDVTDAAIVAAAHFQAFSHATLFKQPRHTIRRTLHKAAFEQALEDLMQSRGAHETDRARIMASSKAYEIAESSAPLLLGGRRRVPHETQVVVRCFPQAPARRMKSRKTAETAGRKDGSGSSPSATSALALPLADRDANERWERGRRELKERMRRIADEAVAEPPPLVLSSSPRQAGLPARSESISFQDERVAAPASSSSGQDENRAQPRHSGGRTARRLSGPLVSPSATARPATSLPDAPHSTSARR